MSRDPAATLALWVARRVAEGRMPAAAWWVETPGAAPHLGHVGHAALVPEPVALRRDTPFDLASLTKPLATGLLLVLLEQDGLIDLDRPVVSLLPELAGSPWDRVAARELALHGSGLPAWRPLCALAADLEGYLALIAATPRAPTVRRTLYSDLGFVLLGALLERAAGSSLAELFDRRIAVPLALAGALGYPSSPLPDAAATEHGNRHERAIAGDEGAAYAWRQDPIRGVVHDANAHALGGVAGHAGLFGTLEATAILVRELACGERLGLGEAARGRLLRVDPLLRRSIGLQAAVDSVAARGIVPDDAVGHTGFTGTSFWIDPRSGGFSVLLTNRVHPRVGRRSFQPLRRGFHRLAIRLLPGSAGGRRPLP